MTDSMHKLDNRDGGSLDDKLSRRGFLKEAAKKAVRIAALGLVLATGIDTIVSSNTALANGNQSTPTIVNNWSPWNSKRGYRPHTRYIVLHTTEGKAKGSLNKLTRNGEAHYMVDTAGTIYQIISHGKIAKHAGDSVWEGHYEVDNHAVGIEIVGWHTKPITTQQYSSVKWLIDDLQGKYPKVHDADVISHSMIAYNPKFSRGPARGRKRCGMQFGDPEVRKKLGLLAQPMHDPDVKAGRVIVGDAYLHKVLYDKATVQNMFCTEKGKSNWFYTHAPKFDDPVGEYRLLCNID